jgi:hypothetical protein
LEGDRDDLDNSEVGWHAVTTRDLNQVSRNELLGFDFFFLSITHDEGFSSLHFHESLKSVLSVRFLPDSYDSVQHDNQNDHEGLHESSHALFTITYQSEEEGDTCCNKQNNDQLILELLQNELP